MYYIKSRWGFFRADASPQQTRGLWTRSEALAYCGSWDDAAGTQRAINYAHDGNTYMERRNSGKQGG